MATAKPRKPRNLRFNRGDEGRIDTEDTCGLPIQFFGWWISVRTAKRLHAWLGRAIAWLEARG